MNSTDIDLLLAKIVQAVSNNANGGNNYSTSTVGMMAFTLLLAGVQFGYSIYKRHNPLPFPLEAKPQV